MKLIYTDDHREHAGAKEMRYDQMIPMSESPERMDLVIQGLADAGFRDVIKPESFPDDHIYAVHDPGFVRFL